MLVTTIQGPSEIVKYLMVLPSSMLTASHMAFARTLMGSSLGIPSASPEFQPFTLCYIALIGMIWGWEALPPSTYTLFLASWDHLKVLLCSRWVHCGPVQFSLLQVTSAPVLSHFSSQPCYEKHLHNMLEQCWSYWCNFPTKYSLV